MPLPSLTVDHRTPDLCFAVVDRDTPRSYRLPGENTADGVLRGFTPRSAPIVIEVADMRGFVLRGQLRDKWLSLGADTEPLGRPTSDEATTLDGRGRFNHFEGGSIYWTEDWGARALTGPIRAKWLELGAERSELGFPTTDVLANGDARYLVFEHGLITLANDAAPASVEPHHYERIYAAVRAQILARCFALGRGGRRNLLGLYNQLRAAPAGTPEEQDRARWRTARSEGENPWLHGSLLTVALAVEHAAGSAESTVALEALLDTLESLLVWREPGAEAVSALPVRWDAGIVLAADSESERFLSGGNGAYRPALPSSDIHHHAWRTGDTLVRLLGPAEAERYRLDQVAYVERYRPWELSMDELTGVVTSLWVIGNLSRSAGLTGIVRRQASLVGNYLANHGYILARPMRALSWRGSMGALPTLEWPISRALMSVTGQDYSRRTDFRGAMERAGHWSQLVGPITAWQIGTWTATALSSALAPFTVAIGLTALAIEGIVAQQALSPSTIGGAIALTQHADCFDIQEPAETALALLGSDAPNKRALYRVVAVQQAAHAPYRAWAANFHSWLGLTGLDDSDSSVRDTFKEWFATRQAHPELELKGQGSRAVFASGVAALVNADDTSERGLVAALERALVELFRESYFEPRLPVTSVEGPSTEYAFFPHWLFERDARNPYSPLDFLAACACAFWHARRRADAGTPVTTARFPQPLSPERVASWPRAVVPRHCLDTLGESGIALEAVQGNSQPVEGADGYGLFDSFVPRRRAAVPAPGPAATELLCDVIVSVRPNDSGDVATGVTLRPGHELQIDATGSIWAGVVADSRNGPSGNPRAIDDARWPLHRGLDARASAFCLLGRLNGYFFIGDGLPRTAWRYHVARPLTLRINDDGPGDGNGQFDVRIRVWGPAGDDPATVYQAPNVMRDGGTLRTSDSADLIEVSVEPGAVAADSVEFVLHTPGEVVWRKEIVIRDAPATGTGTWTIYTQDGRHDDANGLYRYQLAGATLTFRKAQFLGSVGDVAVVGALEAAPPGARITFNWVHDAKK